MRRLWGPEAVGVYELAPLTHEDVVVAAQTRLPDAKPFLRDVSQLGLGTLAAKPLTLDFLLDLFQKEGRLPPSQVAVYEDGFRLLASESNDRRRDVKLVGKYTPDARLAVAPRVAAVLAFADRGAVWRSVEDASVSDADVAVASLAGGTEKARNETVAVTEEAVQETLGSGLFSSRGTDCSGLWHKTAQDYLAVWYLQNRGLDHEQIMALLVHPNDPAGRIVPGLRPVAAWTGGPSSGSAPPDREGRSRSAHHVRRSDR